MIINNQFHKKSFPRVICFILMKDIGRVTPLDFRELEGLDGVLGRLTEDGISLSGLLFVERYMV